MKFVCAIDFTLSNGNPKDSYSLHSVLSEHVSIVINCCTLLGQRDDHRRTCAFLSYKCAINFKQFSTISLPAFADVFHDHSIKFSITQASTSNDSIYGGIGTESRKKSWLAK